jgi:hypothetical protein
MTSEKQRQANQRNARKSTGPTTEEGKRRVSRNALRHGMCAEHLLLPHEDPAALEALQQELVEELQPEGKLESCLVDRIAAALWRLSRALKAEKGLYMCYGRRVPENALASQVVNFTTPAEQEEAAFGVAFVRSSTGADAFTKLSRYEAGLERTVQRALQDLERQQARRGEQYVPSAVVVEAQIEEAILEED